jgi:hypothetical protein
MACSGSDGLCRLWDGVWMLFCFVCPPMPHLINVSPIDIFVKQKDEMIQCIDQSGCTTLIPESELRTNMDMAYPVT